MRVTSLLKRLLGIQHLTVTGFEIRDGALIIDVKPTWRNPRCSRCGKPGSRYGSLELRCWRHLDFGGVRIYLRYAMRRLHCRKDGVVAEQVPWSDSSTSSFTTPFEEAVGFLSQRCDKTSVSEMFSVGWRTVGRIVERVEKRHSCGDPLHGLKALGIDEIAYRKGHKYLTTVTDLLTGRIVWAREGKSSETLLAFFEELGPERASAIEVITMDMSEAYISVVKAKAPQAQIVFDRFHVQQLVSNAVEGTRRQEWRRLQGLDDDNAKNIKGLRWPVLKNPWNLTPKQSERLASLQHDNNRLYRAYLLKESFADILDRHQPNVVKSKLQAWLGWASRSRLPEFVKVGRTIRRHLDDIVSYIRWGLTNGVVEGLHNKVRVIIHRAYGFHSAAAVISMIMLCCTDIQLAPPRLSL